MRRPIVFVLLAGVAALVAAMVVYSALKKREAQIDEAMVKSVSIVVAAKDLSIGSKIDGSSVKLVRWSKDDMPPGAFTDPGAVMNQFTKTSFVTNEPIIGDRLFSGDKNAGVLPLLIPSGMRAISVPVDEVSDISGFVLPHSRVDLLVSVTNSQNGNQPFSKIVLQNVEVLAVAQEIENANVDKPEVVRVVTLLVTPDQAERVVLATHEGPLRMAMRNYEDKKIVDTEGVNMSDLLRSSVAAPVIQPQHVAAAIPIVPANRPVEVEIMRNGKSVENVSFVHNHGGSSSTDVNTAPTGPTASAQDQPDKVASTPSSEGAGADSNPGMEAEATPPAAMTPGLAPVAAAESPPAGVPAAPATVSSSAAGFTAPHAKTIDVP
jgi:pilus assembly protein CpaB